MPINLIHKDSSDGGTDIYKVDDIYQEKGIIETDGDTIDMNDVEVCGPFSNDYICNEIYSFINE